MAKPKAKLPYDLELDYHDKIKKIAAATTGGNATQAVRNAIQKTYEEVIRNED